jgi:stage II sporulation protein R
MQSSSNIIKKTAILTIGIIIISFLAAIISEGGLAGGAIEKTENIEEDKISVQDISSKLIRLHVIANSDSPEDQALKLKVRDTIVKAIENELEDVEDIQESREYIKNHLKEIEQIAKMEVQKEGKDYDVKALFGKFAFPVKTYGYVTLPAGEYEALRIIIGEGGGKNWWCVLFPPLCFVDITRGVPKDEAKIQLSKFLTQEEINAIQTASYPDDVPIEVRFKVVEWWKTAKCKINKTIKIAFK